MPTPAFEWKTYPVRVSSRSPLRGLAIAAPAASDATTEALTEEVRIMIPLPVLKAYMAPLEKAKILLEFAAEIEHALLVQYLYAAYSLKDAKDVSETTREAALDKWSRVLLGIACEEMGHLISVQNLLLLIGHPPNFEREEFPPRKDLYPFKLHLEPLTQRSLAKYIRVRSLSSQSGPGPWV